MQSLVKWDAARFAIAEAYRVDEVLKIRDRAEAIRYALKQAGEAPEVVRQACEIKLRAERRAGQLLRDMPKAQGRGERGLDGKHHQRSQARTPGEPPTLEERGIDRREAARWQKMATVPEQRFEAYLAQEKEPSSAGLLKIAERQKCNVEILEDLKFSALSNVPKGEKVMDMPKNPAIDQLLDYIVPAVQSTKRRLDGHASLLSQVKTNIEQLQRAAKEHRTVLKKHFKLTLSDLEFMKTNWT